MQGSRYVQKLWRARSIFGMASRDTFNIVVGNRHPIGFASEGKMNTSPNYGILTARTVTWSKTAAVPLRSHGAALKQRRSGLELKLPPVVLGAIAAALMWIASWASPTFDINYPANPVFSAILALAGAITCLAGLISFRRAKTTVNPMNPDAASSLVVSGVYRYTRNPMYAGFLLILLGWAAFLLNVLALMVLPAFILYENRFQIFPEERVLTALFADEYTEYLASVRRWF